MRVVASGMRSREMIVDDDDADIVISETESESSVIIVEQSSPKRQRMSAAITPARSAIDRMLVSDGDDGGEDGTEISDDYVRASSDVKEEGEDEERSNGANGRNCTSSDDSSEVESSIDLFNYNNIIPHPTALFDFNALNFLPIRHPLELGKLRDGGEKRKLDQKSRTHLKRRIIEQRETQGEPLSWAFHLELLTTDAKHEGLNKIIHDVSFFPYPHFASLTHMKGVAAMCIGTKIELYELVDVEPSDSDDSATRMIHRCTALSPFHKNMGISRDQPKEEYLTLAWSVDTSYWPFVPILAAGGEGLVVDIYRCSPELILTIDRTMVLHGRRITHLTFCADRPHLLASSSDDRTVCLWNPTVPWASNDAVRSRIKHMQADHLQPRGLMPGELLARLDVSYHTEGVLSCDIHPCFPLIVTSAMDGVINIFRIPLDTLGPTWPGRRPLPRPSLADVQYPQAPLSTPGPLSFGPPIFSSSRLHPGIWCDQVMWADKDDTSIVSKAASPMVDRQLPRLLVKRWQALVLDDRSTEEDVIFTKAAITRSSGFLMLSQIELQGRAYIGDSMGYARNSKASILAIGSDESSLYIFTPNFHPPVRPSPTTSIPPSSTSPAPAPLRNAPTTTLTNIFPIDRPEYEYDFAPRILPRCISDLGEETDVHFRSISISPGVESTWILGVGDGGRVALWRKRQQASQI